MKAAHRDRDTRQEHERADDHSDPTEANTVCVVRVQSEDSVEDVGDDAEQEHEQNPVSVLATTSTTTKGDVLA